MRASRDVDGEGEAGEGVLREVGAGSVGGLGTREGAEQGGGRGECWTGYGDGGRVLDKVGGRGRVLDEGLVNFLVKENGFNIDRVTKAIEKIKTIKKKSSQGPYELLRINLLLESFFKPVSTSAPLKTKAMNTSRIHESLENRPLLTFSLKRLPLRPHIGDF
ncbi:hypothetical protein FXO38_34635 [Capsicum annuum]|nr:hypothetical protein FXO38_34635 [Capsicum annuum]KAF3616797.1 hypothetical protein FXO37_34953 [Capsicum annuum]